MLAGALASLLVLGAPNDAANQLRVAWASQYEWRESGVANAVLDFTYAYHWKGEKDQEWRYGGRAQVVLAEGEIVRRHYPAVTKDRRKQIDPHVVWVLGRFARRPFEEEFQDMVFEGPEPARDGLLRVSAAPASPNKGATVSVTVTVENQGTVTQSFNVTLKDGGVPIGSAKAVTGLASGTTTQLVWSWDTSAVTAGVHTIMATAATVNA